MINQLFSRRKINMQLFLIFFFKLNINWFQLLKWEYFFSFVIILNGISLVFLLLVKQNKPCEDFTLGSFFYFMDQIFNWLIKKIICKLITNENNH